MPTLQHLMARYRQARRDTFNAHFLPYAETDWDIAAFAPVDAALYLVMVLNPIGAAADTAESAARVRFRPARFGVTARVQDPAIGQVAVGRDCVCVYDDLFGRHPYGEADFHKVLGQVTASSDPRLVGQMAVFDWADVEFIGETSH